MLHPHRCILLAAISAAGILSSSAQEPAANPAADEQFRLALGLLLNPRVALHAEAEKEFRAFLAAHPADERAPLARFWLGECLVRSEQQEDALKEHSIVAEQHPQCERHAEALFRVGELSHRLGRFDDAVKAQARFLEQYGDHELAASVRERDVLSRASRLRNAADGNAGEAIALAREDAKRKDAAGQEALALLGTLLFQQGDFAGAANACEEFLRTFPEAANLEEIHFNAGVAHIRLQQDPKALEHLRQVREHRAGEAAYLRGAALLRLDEKTEARKEFRRVVDTYPESPFRDHSLFELGRIGDLEARKTLLAERKSAELADQIACLWASELIENGQAGEALKQLDSVQPDSAVHAEAELLRAGGLYNLGAAHEKDGALPQALKVYDELVQRFPKDRHAPYALFRKGALALDKDRATALQALERIGREHPGFEHAAQVASMIAQGRYSEAWEHYEAGRFEEAAPLFAALVEDETLGADAAYAAALCYRHTKRPTDQEAMLRRVWDGHPQFAQRADVRRLLGEVLMEQRKWQEAAAFYGDWAKEEQAPLPRAEAQLKAGIALFQLNQLPRAKDLLTEAAEHGEPQVRARATFTLGELELNRKQYEEAKRIFLKVSVLYDHAELTPASMVEAAKCMRQLGEADMARKLLEAVVKDYPDSAVAATAQALLR